MKQLNDLNGKYKFGVAFQNPVFDMNPYYKKTAFGGKGFLDDEIDKANELNRSSQSYLKKFTPTFSSELKIKSKQVKFAMEVSANATFSYITVKEANTLNGTKKHIEQAKQYMRREGIQGKKILLDVDAGQDEPNFKLKCLLANTIKADINVQWADPTLYWDNYLELINYASANIVRFLNGVPRAMAKSAKNAVLPTTIYLADVVSHAPILAFGKKNKNQKRLSDSQLKGFRLAKAVRLRADDLGLWRRAESVGIHSQLNCPCPVCQYAGDTTDDFFMTYNEMPYEACGAHNVFTNYETIEMARMHIGNGLKRFFMSREYTKDILRNWYHMNLGQRGLPTV